MAEKRQDKRKRILQSGESQRSDGRYAYKYVDPATGKPKFVYAWKLVPTDRTPPGKRDDLSLREKEKEIQRDIADGIDTAGKMMTVCQLYQKHIRLHGNVRPNTVTERNRFLKALEQDKLGGMAIDRVKQSDAKEWAIRMKEKGVAYQTISNNKRSLRAAFNTAVQDDYIRKNPFDFQIKDVIENDTKKKAPLTPEQEKNLLAFIKADETYQKYYDEFIILLGTGLRISELCGLTTSSLDMEDRKILVDHQLLYDNEHGYYIEMPKTDSGIRQIPMSQGVYEAFCRVQKRRKPDRPYIVDGYGGFLFCRTDGRPRMRSDYSYVCVNLLKKYNKQNNEKLPALSPHLLRHTFCTKMANAGMNPKTLQFIMGHANISMTLDYYAHATFESAKAEMERIVA